MLRSIRRLVPALAILAIAAPLSAFAEAKEFSLGVISDKPAGRIKDYGPVASYVAARLKGFGITGGKLVAAKNVDKMVEKIRKKEVDVVLESAFSTIEMKEKAGMMPKLLVWKKGEKEYRTLFFVRKDSPIQTLDDLKGKTIVFEDPASTSAYLLPKAELKRMGLAVLPMNQRGKPSAVRSVFAGEETNEVFWVIKKKADAGVFSSDDWKELSQKVKADLRIIHETKPVLRFVASFNPALPVELSNAISAILVRMHDDPEGRKILEKAAGTKKMELLSERDYQSLRYVQELAADVEQ